MLWLHKYTQSLYQKGNYLCALNWKNGHWDLWKALLRTITSHLKFQQYQKKSGQPVFCPGLGFLRSANRKIINPRQKNASYYSTAGCWNTIKVVLEDIFYRCILSVGRKIGKKIETIDRGWREIDRKSRKGIGIGLYRLLYQTSV